MIKKIVLTVLSLVLAYNAYRLTSIYFELSPKDFSLLAIIISAFAITLCITGTVAFLGFAFPTSRLLTSSYYKIKNPKNLNRWYRHLGVEYFRIFLLKTFYREKENKKYFNGKRSGVLLFDYNTKQSEFGHLIAFIAIFIVSILLLVNGHLVAFLWILPFNTLLNFYPILPQRKHRIIVERLLARANAKQQYETKKN